LFRECALESDQEAARPGLEEDECHSKASHTL
jgi:hypothetical protein